VIYFARRTVTAIPLAFLCVLVLLAVAAAPAHAKDSGGGGGTTVTYNVPFHGEFVNRCNGDITNLSGTLRNTITTRAAAHGYTVYTKNAVPDLSGTSVLPVPGIPYTGQDVEQNHQYVADPPYPSTVNDYHYTKLVPHPNGPVMYLVIWMRTVIAADGTPAFPTIVGIYLVCSQPCAPPSQ
jgi:hypothetical protein